MSDSEHICIPKWALERMLSRANDGLRFGDIEDHTYAWRMLDLLQIELRDILKRGTPDTTQDTESRQKT